jgi:hypothetical protein
VWKWSSRSEIGAWSKKLCCAKVTSAINCLREKSELINTVESKIWAVDLSRRHRDNRRFRAESCATERMTHRRGVVR